MKNKNILLYLLLLSVSVLTAEEIRIDLKNSVILSPQKRYSQVANDLKKHLDLIGNTDIPIFSSGKAPANKYVFHIGEMPPGTKVKTFKGEEGRFLVTEKAAYFYGNPQVVKGAGTSHAVYAFLEDSLGVRWPGMEEIAYSRRNPVLVTKTQGIFAPAVNLRWIRNRRDWTYRMRMGVHNRPLYGHAFTDWWQKYGKTHPEYFAMNYGKRFPVNWKKATTDDDIAQANASKYAAKTIALCVSNEKVWDRIVENWKRRGKGEYINLCENDTPDNLSCHCKNCMKLDVLTSAQKKDWTHALADRYIYFANNVLARAKKYRKDVKIAMYAYNASQDAPRREKLEKEIVIGIVPTNFTMKSLSDYVLNWKKMGLNSFFYRPNRHHYYLMMALPAGFDKHFFDIMQFMIKQGCIGFDYDSPVIRNPSVQFSDYILAKTLQDPSKSYEYWVNHYLEAYGNAGKEIGKYFEYWRKEVFEKRIKKDINKMTEFGKFHNYGRGLVRNITPYYKESDFIAAGKFLEKAMKAPSLTPVQKKLVKKLVDFNEHGRLFFNAVASKQDSASVALYKFREKHNLPILHPTEQYYGDVAGLKKVQIFTKFTPPYLETDRLWKFRLDPENIGEKEKWYEDGRNILNWKYLMTTDSNWEKPPRHRGISQEVRNLTKNYNGIAWYATAINIPSDWFGKRNIYLYFGAVDECCTVYVNGKKAHVRPYKNKDDWKTPFCVDITKFIKGNSRTPQIVIVRVEDKVGAGGIWRRVHLLSQMKK